MDSIYANDFLEVLIQNGLTLIKVIDPDSKQEWTFIPSDIKPYNPTQHQHSTEIKGKDVTTLIPDYAVQGSIDYNQRFKSLQVKLDEIPVRTYIFSHQFKYMWVK